MNEQIEEEEEEVGYNERRENKEKRKSEMSAIGEQLWLSYYFTSILTNF